MHNIAIYADDTNLYSKFNQVSDLWQQLELASELESDLESDLWDTVCRRRRWLIDFNPGKMKLVLFDRSTNTGATDVKYGWVCSWLTFSSKLDLASYIIYIDETASKKIEALICSMKFLSPEVSLYLYKSTIQPCIEHCCHFWVGDPSCYLELFDKLQNEICRTVGSSLAISLDWTLDPSLKCS